MKIEELIVECSKCNHKFRVSVTDKSIKRKRYIMNDYKKIYLTYYICPKCGEKYFVQIDDDKSLLKLKQEMKLFKELYNLRVNDKAIKKSKLNLFKAMQEDLSLYRKKLMVEYTGKEINEDGIKSKLNFIV